MMKRELLSVALSAVMGVTACGGQSKVKPGTNQDSSNVPDAGDSGVEAGPVDGLSCDIGSTPCGGDVVGRWQVMDCPLELTGEVDVQGLGIGCRYGETISGSLVVSGALTLDAM